MKHKDGRNVAFGKVIEGQDVLAALENIFATKGKPVSTIKIASAGSL